MPRISLVTPCQARRHDKFRLFLYLHLRKALCQPLCDEGYEFSEGGAEGHTFFTVYTQNYRNGFFDFPEDLGFIFVKASNFDYR